MSEQKNGLTIRQERAVMFLLTQPTVGMAAKAANVSERSIHRWLGDPIFDAEYRKARRQAFGLAVAKLQQTAHLAASTLAGLLTDVAAPAHVRVSAALGILRFAREGVELDDLEDRLANLEARLEESNR